MDLKKISDHNDIASQIIIIGGGGGGLTAALAAAEMGGRVVVVEKRRVLGGNTVMASVLFGAETPYQKRMKIDISKDWAFKMAMGYAHWKIDPMLVRTFIDKTGDTIRWLEEKGLEFLDIPNYYPNQDPRVFHFVKGHGAALVKTLSKKCKTSGVKFLYQTSAKKILKNREKAVSGILAETPEGEIRIPGKCVIIATGGYGGSKELIKKYCSAYSEDMVQFGMPINVGDGLRLATGAGAATEGLGMIQLIGPRFAGSSYVAAIVVEPNTIWINKKGERFVDESLSFRWPEAGNALARQPDKICYTLFDESIKRIFINNGVSRGFMAYPTGTKMTKLDKEIRAQLKNGEIKISESWKEIADWIGVAPDILEATINDYNNSCKRGYDELFAKDLKYLLRLSKPPFYAIKCHQGFHGTVGGIKINHCMEVMDKQDKPIPGLYAAGSDTGGWEGDTYCLDLSGSTFAFALNSGRIAGENAFKYISGK